MKNVFLAICSISILIVALSVAYYFLVLLPKINSESKVNTETIQKQIDRIKRNQSIDNSEASTINKRQHQVDMEAEERLNEINATMQDMQSELEAQNSCEANGGLYRGSGVCCLSNCY